MRQEKLPDSDRPVTYVHTLVIGSGASGLAAAVRLRAEGVDDLLIVTEGLDKGTSINTGSDKQTYYKLSLYGADADAPRLMAESYFAGGSMHGDLALVEAGLSARCFMHLVNLGVPFPTDAWGQFVGYKTDHDPRQRATSIGPYTSREMCRALIRRVRELQIEVREGRDVSQLLTLADARGASRVAGALATTREGRAEVYLAENVVLAVGGPGGLYQTSVYPEVHTGAIGLALMAGARAQSLPESQFGLASIGHRWNVSGTYMQVIPRLISTSAGGTNGGGPDAREFLRDYFATPGEMHSQLFLKGYQWPFDARKAVGGSSLIDVLVYVETVIKGRRVYLDYRRDPEGFAFTNLSPEAREYLVRSRALLETPIERLRAMNPGAVELYAGHGIDLARQPLEIAVCAQHNNGGLAGNAWYESSNVAHLFCVGEVNGSHGVYRPGGSALNAGQVGAFRAAEYIAHRYGHWSLSTDRAAQAAQAAVAVQDAWLARCAQAGRSWQAERDEFQARMTRAGAHIRSAETLQKAREEAWAQWARLSANGCAYSGPAQSGEALRTRQLCFAHAVYLDAIAFAVGSGVGSRGSAIVLDPKGARIHQRLGNEWRLAPEDLSFRERVLETTLVEPDPSGAGLGAPRLAHAWVPRRPIPESDAWFETAWARYREGEIYGDEGLGSDRSGRQGIGKLGNWGAGCFQSSRLPPFPPSR